MAEKENPDTPTTEPHVHPNEEFERKERITGTYTAETGRDIDIERGRPATSAVPEVNINEYDNDHLHQIKLLSKAFKKKQDHLNEHVFASCLIVPFHYPNSPPIQPVVGVSFPSISQVLVTENDGSKFAEVIRAMGSQASELSAEDVAGGLKSSASLLAEKGLTNLRFVAAQASKIDVKNGWTSFADSIKTEETRTAFLKAPAGVAFCMAAGVLYLLFGVMMFTAKYGPSVVRQASAGFQKASEVLIEGSQVVNERAIVPMKQKLRPIIADAKVKIDQAIAERWGALGTKPPVDDVDSDL